MATDQGSGKRLGVADAVFGFSFTPIMAAQASGSSVDAGSKSQKLKGEKPSTHGRLVLFGGSSSWSDLQGWLNEQMQSTLGQAWVAERLRRKRGEAMLVSTEAGPVWLLALPSRAISRPMQQAAGLSYSKLFDVSPYGQARDIVGPVISSILDHQLADLSVEAYQADADEQRGLLVGLELGFYRFRTVRQAGLVQGVAVPSARLPALKLAQEFSQQQRQEAESLGVSINLARHLVNLPPNDLNPQTYASQAQQIFKNFPAMQVEVWTGKRLEKERMGLLLAVGQGSQTPPALVHLRYRPKGKLRCQQTLAFVGKGVTFDTGGLDIKDAGSMRLMKKDMGGSASVLGLAYWVAQSGSDIPCDFYLALAENAVDQQAFRPGDIITARNGHTIEIDNTDAEGRLVLADAMDVALSGETAEMPLALFDLATLTGAMRVALGTRIGGMFATHDDLADAVLAAGQAAAEPLWRMPLFQDYAQGLRSSVADVANSGPGRFGGAITAALFLQRFIATKCPWVHIDMYGWTDAVQGALTEPGGTGQCVQALAQLLTQWSRDPADVLLQGLIDTHAAKSQARSTVAPAAKKPKSKKSKAK